MIIECTSCHARYQYDEDRFERKPSKKIKCAKCATVFEIHNPAFAPKKPTLERDLGDLTFSRRQESKPKPAEQDTASQAPIPSEERVTGTTPAVAKLPEGKRLSLAIINGPDAGSVFRIEKPRVTIGRSGADITLNDTEASRVHAAVEIRDMTYLVEDLKSTNGTLMDGAKIEGLTELQNHSEFQVGESTLMLIVTEDV